MMVMVTMMMMIIMMMGPQLSNQFTLLNSPILKTIHHQFIILVVCGILCCKLNYSGILKELGIFELINIDLILAKL